MMMHKDKLSFPLLVSLSVRLILTIWLAAAWVIIDLHLKMSGEFLSKRLPMLPTQTTLAGQALLDVWMRWDAVHFINIAETGYTVQYPGFPISPYAYFPAYPLLVRWTTFVLAKNVNQMEAYAVVGLLLSFIATFVALNAFQKLILIHFNDPKLAKWTMLLWITFPTSYFLFAPYSDSLFAAFTLFTFLWIAKKKWLLAGVFCALAGFTRGQGILITLSLGFALLLELVRQRRFPSISEIAGLLISPLGWIAYQWWLQTEIQNNLFSLYSYGWQNSLADPVTVFVNSILFAVKYGNAIVFAEIFSILAFGFTLVWMITKPQYRKAPELLVYSILTIGSFMVWDCRDCSGYVSSLRYILSLFPVFIGLAWLILQLPTLVRKSIIAINVLLLLFFSLLYACWVFVA